MTSDGEEGLEAQKHLEELLLEGLEGGPTTPMTMEGWADIRREVAERLVESRAAIQSGRGIEVTPEFWQKRREELLARQDARRKAREL